MTKRKKWNEWKLFVERHPTVKEWLRNRPLNTRRQFAGKLRDFCEAVNLTPTQWRDLDKFEARDLAWKYARAKLPDHPRVASNILLALKSWYRNKDGERLPFDSTRGGKHYIQTRSKKAMIEHIPNKQEVYQLIDMAANLRDKSILFTLFCTGVRVNVLEHLKYKHVANQLDQDTITLKITGDLDHKLRSRNIPFYYTFLNGEGAATLKRYCALKHRHSTPDTPLFSTRGNKSISQSYIWKIVKTCVARAGLDPKTIWTHTLRKAYRKIIRQTDIDDDDKEQLMGHVLPGSRESYYDKKDTRLILEAYQKCDFTEGVEPQDYKALVEKVHLLEANSKHKELEIQRLRVQNRERISKLETDNTLIRETVTRLEKLFKKKEEGR